MAQAFVSSKIQPRKVVVFIKPTCPYCSKTQELLRQFPFKEGLLECVDISATSDTNEIQACLQHLMGARMVPRVFIGKEYIVLPGGWIQGYLHPASATVYLKF
uniref:Glutaredoxin-1 n=1 Tax=Sus scrofa TaxID=9823 RepID=A0A8D1M6T5_PIG